MIKSDYKSLSEFENRSTCSGVWADFKSGSYSSLSSYKTYIDYDDFEQYVGSGLFGDKYKTFIVIEVYQRLFQNFIVIYN